VNGTKEEGVSWTVLNRGSQIEVPITKFACLHALLLLATSVFHLPHAHAIIPVTFFSST